VPRPRLKRNWRSVSRELLGDEKRRAIAEYMEWFKSRKAAKSVHKPDDYPLAVWARGHSTRLAGERSDSQGYYRNSKPRPRGRR
jgi:hypothetical protein